MPQAQGARRPRERRGRQAQRAQQRDRRIEVRHADADQGGLRRQLHFRGPDVRAAAQQVGRHVDDDVQLGLRDRVLALGHLGQRARGPGQQDAQGVLRLAQR